MTWWPGWDSVDGAGFWSQFWFWVAIVCLFAVGPWALLSHIYGSRKAELISDEVAAVAARQTADVATPRDKVNNATAPHKLLPPKVLTPTQQKTLIAALGPFAGQKVRVDTLAGGDDELARDFIEVFRAARWDVDPASPAQIVLATRLFGVQPTINRADTVPPAFPALVDALAALEIGRA